MPLEAVREMMFLRLDTTAAQRARRWSWPHQAIDWWVWSSGYVQLWLSNRAWWRDPDEAADCNTWVWALSVNGGAHED